MESSSQSDMPDDALEQFELGLRYELGEDLDKDFSLAAHWYLKAAKQGLANAQYSLGLLYAEGHGVAEDQRQAAVWYLRAAKQGHASAQCNIAIGYYRGEGVVCDHKLALRWMLKSANQSEGDAQFNLGIFYLAGIGTVVNRETAAGWFKLAGENGNSRAEIELQKLINSGFLPAKIKIVLDADAHAGDINADLKLELQLKELALKRHTYTERGSGKVAVTPCPICKVKIANRALKNHIRGYHRPEPKIDPNAPKRKKAKKLAVPDFLVLPVSPRPKKSARLKNAPIKATPRALCPRCSGDGGVRGGCAKCDGTGWVRLAMENDVHYRPDHSIGENTRISNSDYLGENRGAHFREIDGRIGTNPSHDDYSEES